MYAIFKYQSFNYTLTNDIITFEQLGPDLPAWKGRRICVFAGYSHAILRECYAPAQIL